MIEEAVRKQVRGLLEVGFAKTLHLMQKIPIRGALSTKKVSSVPGYARRFTTYP